MRLPSIRLGTLTTSRLVAGSNPISGYSHAGEERTARMVEYFTTANIKALLATCERHGVTSLIARADVFIMRVLHEYWGEGGRIQWIAQTAPEHRDPLRNITQAHRWGAAAIYVHGGVVDRLFAANRQEEVRAMIDHIRALGVPAGMAAHLPSRLLTAQELGFPVDFFMVCMYQVGGYRGRQGEEPAEHFDDRHRAIALDALTRLRKPCLAYKVLAAGRKTPEEGLRDVAAALRPTDGVVLGMFPPDAEDMVRRNVELVCRMTQPASWPARADAAPVALADQGRARFGAGSSPE